MLLSGRFVPLGLTLLAPVIVNILGFHIFLVRGGFGPPAFVLGLELYLAWVYRDAFVPMLRVRAVAKTPGVEGAREKTFVATEAR